LIGFTILIMLIPGGLGIISKSRKWLFIKWGVSELFFQELFEILFGACDWSIFEFDSLFQVGIWVVLCGGWGFGRFFHRFTLKMNWFVFRVGGLWIEFAELTVGDVGGLDGDVLEWDWGFWLRQGLLFWLWVNGLSSHGFNWPVLTVIVGIESSGLFDHLALLDWPAINVGH
jgi:hypothetical protein